MTEEPETRAAQDRPETGDSTPMEATTPWTRRKRTGRKRTVFHRYPQAAWPVRGLWESAPAPEKERAHRTCMLILEYWLGKKSKSEVAAELEVKPLRVWQLSQQALSGMMAGLLPQPRRRVSREVFEPRGSESREALKRRITTLERELARTEDLVRVLRSAPWRSPGAESPEKGGRRRGRKTAKPRGTARAKPKAPERAAGADRSAAPEPPAHGGGAGASG